MRYANDVKHVKRDLMQAKKDLVYVERNLRCVEYIRTHTYTYTHVPTYNTYILTYDVPVQATYYTSKETY